MEDFRTLKVLDRFKGMFEKMGVDYSIMRRILQVKLMMDQRRVPTIFSQSTKRKKRKIRRKETALLNHFGFMCW